MNISAIQPKMNKKTYIKNQNKKPDTSFLGLSNDFKRKIYPETSYLKKIYLTSQKDIAGCPPNDIIRAIKSKSDCTSATDKNVKKFISSLHSAVAILRELDSARLESVKNLELDKFFQKYFDALKAGNVQAAIKITDKIISIDNISKDTLEKIEKRAAKIIDKTLKETHVLKNSDHVEVKYCAEGVYGYVFQISFKDENDKDVFHSKAIKIYKSEECEAKQTKIICEKLKNYYASMTFDDYWKNSLAAFDAVFGNSNFSEQQKKSMISEMKKIIKDNFESIRSSDIDDLWTQMSGCKIAMSNENGCLPEANRSMYIKKCFGDLTHSNYIMPYYFNLSNEYALMEYSDDKLPPVDKHLDLASLGLYHRDICFNKANTVCSRIVDYGGISQMNLGHDLLLNLFTSSASK